MTSPGHIGIERLVVRACKHKNLVIHINTHTWGQVSWYECLLALGSSRVSIILRSFVVDTVLDARIKPTNFSFNRRYEIV